MRGGIHLRVSCRLVEIWRVSNVGWMESDPQPEKVNSCCRSPCSLCARMFQCSAVCERLKNGVGCTCYLCDGSKVKVEAMEKNCTGCVLEKPSVRMVIVAD